MAQLRTGLVNLTNGSTLVTSTGADWSTAAAGNIFVVKSNNVPYFISSVSYVGGQWQATLSAPYLQTTATNQQYAIVTSFTPNYDIPLIEPGDIETATVFTRAMSIIDGGMSTLASTVGGSGNVIVISETADSVTLSIS